MWVYDLTSPELAGEINANYAKTSRKFMCGHNYIFILVGLHNNTPRIALQQSILMS